MLLLPYRDHVFFFHSPIQFVVHFSDFGTKATPIMNCNRSKKLVPLEARQRDKDINLFPRRRLTDVRNMFPISIRRREFGVAAEQGGVRGDTVVSNTIFID